METPLVSIIMGSDSDLPVMQQAAQILAEFGITHDVHVISAHRTPDAMVAFAKEAVGKGTKVIIAGAGGAAHLPGMTAAFTSLPVIGVPVMTTTAAGVDSLFSIAQMPPGIPVATVAINGAKNAGILAAQIIGASDMAVRAKIDTYKASLKAEISGREASLQGMGYKAYLAEKGLI